MSDLNITSGFPIVPAPWTLLAESWVFLGYHSSSQIQRIKSQPVPSQDDIFSSNAQIEQASGLFPGSYHPLETLPEILRVGEDDSDGLEKDEFKGGLCGWVLFRYSDSPVGPYDELIYISGSFSSPETSTSGLRITNIVVSTEPTTVSGRANWNIPKHQGKFQFSAPVYTKDSKQTQMLTVYHPENSPLNSSTPFFSATFQWVLPSLIPSIPITTDLPIISKVIKLIQPNLLPSELYTDEILRNGSIGTEKGVYRSTAPTFKGTFELASCKPNLENGKEKSYGDGKSFPIGSNMLGVGVHFKKVEVGFPLSEESIVGNKRRRNKFRREEE